MLTTSLCRFQFYFCQILLGPGSVGGRMELAGYPVLPPNKSTTAASDGYNRMFKAGSS